MTQSPQDSRLLCSCHTHLWSADQRRHTHRNRSIQTQTRQTDAQTQTVMFTGETIIRLCSPANNVLMLLVPHTQRDTYSRGTMNVSLLITFYAVRIIIIYTFIFHDNVVIKVHDFPQHKNNIFTVRSVFTHWQAEIFCGIPWQGHLTSDFIFIANFSHDLLLMIKKNFLKY